VSDEARGFVPLRSLRPGLVDPQRVLAGIRAIYFKTTSRTIQHDLEHAIELLKTLPTEDDREKARVYMDGLAQMRSDWAQKTKGTGRARGTRASRDSGGKGERRKRR
jgi:hypothetical protein